jgi:LemA protein
MLPILIVIAAIGAVIAAWSVITQRKLVMLDENISNAMCLIGVQMSGKFDVLMYLLELAKSYDVYGSENLIEKVRSERGMIMAKSVPGDVLRQESIITDIFGRFTMVSGQNHELITDPNYIKAMDAVHTLENMLRTSRMIYNDSVAKLNRVIRMFPTSLVALVLGFRQRDYLEG